MAGLPGVCLTLDQPYIVITGACRPLLRNCANDRHAQRGSKRFQKDRHLLAYESCPRLNESSVAVKAMDVFFDVMGIDLPEFFRVPNQLLGGNLAPEAT